MARVQIDMPEKYPFSTKLQVRIGDVTGDLHLGNHVLVSYLNEALLLFLRDNGFPSIYIEDLSFINTDLAVIYKSEAFHGDELLIEVAISKFTQYGCDFYFRVTNERTGQETAHAKTGMLFFDYDNRKVANVPESFQKVFEQYCF